MRLIPIFIITLTYLYTVPFADPYGTKIGSFAGVEIISNGSTSNVSNEYNTSAGVNTGMKWQCIEFCNRVYYTKFGLNIRIVGDNANDYYKKATDRNLDAFSNGSSPVPPMTYDILCSDSGDYGHVAIVKEVLADHIIISQQNWNNDYRDTSMQIKMSKINGSYKLDGFNSKYQIVGWLRNKNSSFICTVDPTTATVGQIVKTTWSGFNGNINLEVWKGNNFWTYANTDIAGSGSQDLNTTSMEIRDDYRVRVVLRSDTLQRVFSEYFQVKNATNLINCTNNLRSEMFFIRVNKSGVILNFDFIQPTFAKLNIYNIFGRVLYSIDKNFDQGYSCIEFKNLPNGNYFINFNGVQYSWSRKFIVNR